MFQRRSDGSGIKESRTLPERGTFQGTGLTTEILNNSWNNQIGQEPRRIRAHKTRGTSGRCFPELGSEIFLDTSAGIC